MVACVVMCEHNEAKPTFILTTGCSAAGSAPGSGLGSRGFESRHSDQIRLIILIPLVLKLSTFFFL